MILSDSQKDRIRQIMNPEGHNYKDCNFFRVVGIGRDFVRVEVGYWITYTNCKPKYQKETIPFKYSELKND